MLVFGDLLFYFFLPVMHLKFLNASLYHLISSGIGGVMTNSQKRHLWFFILLANQYFLHLGCLMDLKLFLRIWSHIYREKFLARHSSFGGCNHQGIFMVVSGTKMEVVCSMSPSRNMRYEQVDDGSSPFMHYQL